MIQSTGRGLESAGRAMEPAVRAMEPAVRAMEPARRALEPAGRPGASWEGQLTFPGGGRRKKEKKKRAFPVRGGTICHHPLRGHCSKSINYPVFCVFFLCVMEGLTDGLTD